MASPAVFKWPVIDQFIDRDAELARLEGWWESGERMPVDEDGRKPKLAA